MLLTREKLEKIKLIKDLRIALKDFEPMVKNPQHLWNGRDIQNFSLRPREAWANWLICAVLGHMHKRNITFMEDDKGDGFVVDKDKKIIVPTEHVSALNIPKEQGQPPFFGLPPSRSVCPRPSFG